MTVATGGFFGELSLLDGRRAVFAKLLRAEPAIAIAILTELAARLRRTDTTP